MKKAGASAGESYRRRKHRAVGEAVSRIADLFEYGHLMMQTDAVAFYEMIENEIKRLGEELKTVSLERDEWREKAEAHELAERGF